MVRRIIIIVLIILVTLFVGVVIYIGAYTSPEHRKLKLAGIEEKQVQIGEVLYNYAEGPDNGPAFGDAFYEGTWNEGFDHSQALSRITCPVLLIQADTSFMEDGTLNGAMSEEMAEKAMSLLPNGAYIRVDAGHVTNLEIPEDFVNLLTEFFLKQE